MPILSAKISPLKLLIETKNGVDKLEISVDGGLLIENSQYGNVDAFKYRNLVYIGEERPLHLQLLFENKKWLKSVEVCCPKISVSVEDIFIFKILEELRMLVEKLQLEKNSKNASVAMEEFLFLDALRLDETVVEISAKSNYIFHLAADKSKITLKKFDLAPFSGYKSELTNELANHYLYQIIRQVGWFIGGLEAFGSPGNFIRGLSAGVVDFLTLPVKGIQNGAFGVIRGAADGTKSLVKNASFSFISSITNIADSLASNTELLALDGLANDPSRNNSEGLFSSVNEQLRGLGMTVLGSVAGLVQHPINAALEENSDSALLKSSKVAFAAGRGIAGLVLQPVGGLSKVIAKTGSSLLGKTQEVEKSRKLIFKKIISISLLARALEMQIIFSERCQLRAVGRNGWILISREQVCILLDGEDDLFATFLVCLLKILLREPFRLTKSKFLALQNQKKTGLLYLPARLGREQLPESKTILISTCLLKFVT